MSGSWSDSCQAPDKVETFCPVGMGRMLLLAAGMRQALGRALGEMPQWGYPTGGRLSGMNGHTFWC